MRYTSTSNRSRAVAHGSASIDREKKQVELSFRSGDLKKNAPASMTLADLTEGQKVEGRVKKIEDYGLFIEIEGSRVSWLCHKSEVLLSP